MRWLDTNILIRYLTQDDPVKRAACLTLLQRVEREEEEVRTCEAVIRETVFVLSFWLTWSAFSDCQACGHAQK